MTPFLGLSGGNRDIGVIDVGVVVVVAVVVPGPFVGEPPPDAVDDDICPFVTLFGIDNDICMPLPPPLTTVDELALLVVDVDVVVLVVPVAFEVD